MLLQLFDGAVMIVFCTVGQLLAYHSLVKRNFLNMESKKCICK
jgi:hypothetical protein